MRQKKQPPAADAAASDVTSPRLIPGDARAMNAIPDGAVDLVVTSPPYPMIEMWDEIFTRLSPAAGAALAAERGKQAFELMHLELDRVWQECHRVLRDGGLACINIGDATRSMGGEFQLYPNHVRIVTAMSALGFQVLPDILWRKPTNAPNKFMGSGMLPAGAYVTYEHEYVLILRKGGKRVFAEPEQKHRRERSAYFWEERNVWFSDVWMDLRGARQAIADPETRSRSGAFPFELPYRLIQMFSVQRDTVLDPFAGIGTTTAAALASGHNSIGIEIEPTMIDLAARAVAAAPRIGEERVSERLRDHLAFVAARVAAGKELGNHNTPYGFPVITRQEKSLTLECAHRLEPAGPGVWRAFHDPAAIGLAAGDAPDLPFAAGAAADGD